MTGSGALYQTCKLKRPNERTTKMFRCFDIIAAAAYAAEETANGHERGPWDELTDDERNEHVRRVMAFKRGETEATMGGFGGDRPESFEAVARAILDFNNGQGALALEKLAQLGEIPFDLELISTDDVAGKDIAEVLSGLLEELAKLRDAPPSDDGSTCDLRQLALSLASQRSTMARTSAVSLEAITDAAETFHDFLRKPAEDCWHRYNALRYACDTIEAGARATSVVIVAEDFFQFLEPPTADIAHARAELEDATVQ